MKKSIKKFIKTIHKSLVLLIDNINNFFLVLFKLIKTFFKRTFSVKKQTKPKKVKKTSKKTIRKRKKSIFSVIFKNAFIIALSLFFVFVGFVFLWVASLEIPSIHNIDLKPITQSTKIYDRTGKVILYYLNEDVRRTIVPLGKISKHVVNATVAIEDDEFFKHKGIKIKAILRAVFANLKEGGFVQGGSTITQQVIKNMLLTKEKTIKRKIKEWILAIKLERYKSKEEILELYLNTAPYGGVIYGIEEAAKYYFGKSAKELTLAESAYLAALPQRPSYLSPYGPNKDKLEQRKNLVLKRMLENGFITKSEYDDAMKEKVEFIDNKDGNIKAPHFVFFVKKYLEEKYGKEAAESGGLQVITTLDYKLQKKLEEIVKNYSLQAEKRYGASNAAAVVINSRTGEILAMVGSRDFFDEKIDGQYNITTARRQPGSSFKPIVYSLLFEKGYTPSTILFDLPTQFSTSCPINNFVTNDTCYSPKNWDNSYRGPMTIRSAIAQSINIPAVKALYLAGLSDAYNHAKKLGISISGPINRYGFSFVLGTAEVSLLDMVYAYASFSNEGKLPEKQFILEIKDSNDVVLEKFEKPETKQVLDKNSAAAISDILSDVPAKIPAYGPNSSLYYTNYKVAVKTGTTNNFKDLLVIGYTPDHVAGVWMGNNDNTPVANQFAGVALAPLWKQVMNETINRYGIKHSFPEYIPPETDKAILKGLWQINTPSGTQVHSILHWVDKNNPLGPIPENPFKDPQYTRWEYSVQSWAASKSLIQNAATSSNTNIAPNNPINGFFAKIVYPNNTVKKGQVITSKIAYPPNSQISYIEYYLNGTFIGSSSKAPYSLSFIPTKTGKNTLKIVTKGQSGVVVDTVIFNVSD